jgi:hypothetical protein
VAPGGDEGLLDDFGGAIAARARAGVCERCIDVRGVKGRKLLVGVSHVSSNCRLIGKSLVWGSSSRTSWIYAIRSRASEFGAASPAKRCRSIVRLRRGVILDGMDPHVSVITLGVRDLRAARRFYVEGLGWDPTLNVPNEVVFIQVGHGLLLALYRRDDLAKEAGDIYAGPQRARLSLGHVVDDEATVAEVLSRAVAAGGTVVSPAERRSWGGVSGYFADPDGFRWEIAHNPGLKVASNGRVTVGPVGD